MASGILAREGRVAIRRFRRRDLEGRMTWPPYTDPYFTHLNYDLSTFLEREKWILSRTLNTGRIYFAIEDESGRLIGEMSLRDVDASDRVSRLGIHLASNKVGMGYGSDALKALLSYYFRTMAWNVMYLDVAAHNVRALHVYEKLHFGHLAPFWRRVFVEAPIFSDPRYADVRATFRIVDGHLEALHYDMALTRERYLREFLDRKASPMSTESPERKNV
jgi:RimJ/RimL family protein N-acetyltransferase